MCAALSFTAETVALIALESLHVCSVSHLYRLSHSLTLSLSLVSRRPSLACRRALANPLEAEEEEEEVDIPPLNLVREGPEKATTGGTPRLEDGTDNLSVARTKTVEVTRRDACPPVLQQATTAFV